MDPQYYNPYQQPINPPQDDEPEPQSAPQSASYSDHQAVEFARAKIASIHGDSYASRTDNQSSIQAIPAQEYQIPRIVPRIPDTPASAPADPYLAPLEPSLPVEEFEQVAEEVLTPAPAAYTPPVNPEPYSYQPPQLTTPAPQPQPYQQPNYGSFNMPLAPTPELIQQVAANAQAVEPVKKVPRWHPANALDWLAAKLTKQNLKQNFKPILSAALVGCLVFVIFNSQIIIGQVQYLTNPNQDTSTPVIEEVSNVNAPVSSEPRIIIPKINVSAPVVYDVTTFDESAVQKALERGVVHYGTTAVPGERGNNVIVGHSSNNWWAAGKYKFAFVLLDKLEKGDTFSLHYKSKRYVYEVTGKKIVEPTDVSVLRQTREPTVTLITCTPPGTSWHRLVVTAKQISPDPTKSTARQTNSQAAEPKVALPGNTPSIIDKLRQWLFGS